MIGSFEEPHPLQHAAFLDSLNEGTSFVAERHLWISVDLIVQAPDVAFKTDECKVKQLTMSDHNTACQPNFHGFRHRNMRGETTWRLRG